MNKNDAPDRIKAWKSKLYGRRWGSSGQVCPLAFNCKTHEYTLTSVADKQMQAAMKPIRDTLEDYLVNGEGHVPLDEFIKSVRESLSIADKGRLDGS